MASSSDFISLANAKAFYGNNPPASDIRLQTLITALSTSMLSKLQRPSILPMTYIERRDGCPAGIMLRRWPVVSISSVSIVSPTARTIFASDDPCQGYLLDDASAIGGPGSPTFLYGPFPRGTDNILVSYVAGYQVTAETAQIPEEEDFSVEVAQPYGLWASDVGVSYANGAPLVAVQGPPAQGQYNAISGVYIFSADDAGAAVAISYGYVPQDLSYALLEWVSDRLAYASRVGMRSQSVGGQETNSFVVTATPAFVLDVLQNYMSVVPIL